MICIEVDNFIAQVISHHEVYKLVWQYVTFFELMQPNTTTQKHMCLYWFSDPPVPTPLWKTLP